MRRMDGSKVSHFFGMRRVPHRPASLSQAACRADFPAVGGGKPLQQGDGGKLLALECDRLGPGCLHPGSRMRKSFSTRAPEGMGPAPKNEPRARTQDDSEWRRFVQRSEGLGYDLALDVLVGAPDPPGPLAGDLTVNGRWLMSWLERRIPPPLVALITAFGMWLVTLFTPAVPAAIGAGMVASAVFAVAGVLFSAAAAMAFRRAGTTIDPMRPERARLLVQDGVYRISRNPMYVGVASLLLAWAFYLAAPWALLGPVFFILFIDRFQIRPEERALQARFAEDFARYRARVRRWL